MWVRFSPSSLSTTAASHALSSPGEWTTALDWASMKGALHDRRLYGGSMMLATTTTATTTMEVKKTAAAAGKRNDRGSFGGRGGGVAMAKERASMRCRCTGSWRRGLVAGSVGGEREGTAKNRPRHYPQRGQAGAGASAAGACRAATAGIRQGGRWELRNGRRLRSAKQAPRPSELLHARPGKFLKTESKVHLKVETFLLLLHATRGLFFLFFGPQFLLSSPWIFLLLFLLFLLSFLFFLFSPLPPLRYYPHPLFLIQ